MDSHGKYLYNFLKITEPGKNPLRDLVGFQVEDHYHNGQDGSLTGFEIQLQAVPSWMHVSTSGFGKD